MHKYAVYVEYMRECTYMGDSVMKAGGWNTAALSYEQRMPLSCTFVLVHTYTHNNKPLYIQIEASVVFDELLHFNIINGILYSALNSFTNPLFLSYIQRSKDYMILSASHKCAYNTQVCVYWKRNDVIVPITALKGEYISCNRYNVNFYFNKLSKNEFTFIFRYILW